MKKILFAAVLTLSAAMAVGQRVGATGSPASGSPASAMVRTLIVPEGILLPKDSATRVGLIASLEGWLGQRNKPDSVNSYLSQDAATSAFMDELRSIDWYSRRDSVGDCRCYLGNVVSLDSLRCLVQLNYMEVRKDTPVLRACCTVMARRGDDNRWLMSSILTENTVSWKMKAIGNCVFHYKTSFNEKKASAFVERIASYDKRLHTGPVSLDYYICDNLAEAMHVAGEDYRSDYNGLAYEEFSGDQGNHTVVLSGWKLIDGFNDWDTHDWWHGRLHRVVPVSTIYRPVDEGMAYLYGGSWRVYTWKDVLARFKDYAAAHPDADWLALYKSGVDYVAEAHNLKISYVINALIVQRIGFDAAMPLVTCGPKRDGDTNYFAALKRVTGIDEAGFNAYVAELIKGSEKL